jgi:hypothetical protein
MFRQRTLFRPLDALVILSVTAASAWGFLSFRLTDGSQAIIYLGNRKFARYDLAGPARAVDIPTRIGTIVLEIGNGSAKVASTPCRNRVCLKTGAIRFSHAEIVCMPARMLVVLEGAAPSGSRDSQDPGKETDAVTY